MKIYLFHARLNDFDFITPAEGYWDELSLFKKAEPLPNGYQNFKAEYHFHTQRISRPFDISSPSLFPLFNERALEILYPLVKTEIEYCPVKIIKPTFRTPFSQSRYFLN